MISRFLKSLDPAGRGPALLWPADMLVASQVLSGKREISKAHARRLAERFRLSVEAFI